MPARLLTPEAVPALLDDLSGADLVAVDTEFHAERRYMPKLYLVQVHVPGGDVWIIDPLEGDLLQAIAPALRAARWIVHGGSQDIRLLNRALGGVPDEVLDTQIGSALVVERFPEGYSSLVQRHLGKVLPKASTLSDWSRRPLTDAQLAYAADDVLRLPGLWAAIERSLIERQRYDVAVAACVEACHNARREPDPAEAWRRFGAAAGMTARARAILRELCRWREARAQEKNQPPRTVLGDGSIIELAKRPPPDRDGILANRRFPRSAHKHVDTIWAVIGKGRAVPSSEAPECPERYSEPWRTLQVLTAWATLIGHEEGLSPHLVLDSERLADFALHPPRSREELATRLGPWRDELVGPRMWRWFEGQLSIVMQGGRAALNDAAPRAHSPHSTPPRNT